MAPTERSRTACNLHIKGFNTLLGARLLASSKGKKTHFFLSRLREEMVEQEVHLVLLVKEQE